MSRVPTLFRDPDHSSCRYSPGWWKGYGAENEEGNARYQAERGRLTMYLGGAQCRANLGGWRMTKRIVDLSVTLKPGIASDPPGFLPHLDYVDHNAGASQMAGMFPGLDVDDLPGREGWAVEFVRMSTHSGTHMDAPYHYRSRTDSERPAATIDEIPYCQIEKTCQPGTAARPRVRGDQPPRKSL